MEYFVSEGNKIGYLPTEFGSTGALVEKKLVADGDIAKGDLVVVSDAWKVKKATAATAAFVIGVAMFDAKDKEPVSVETEGLFKMTAGAAITAPAILSAGDAGKVVTQTAGSQSGTTPFAYTAATKAIGIAISDAAADGDPVYVKFSI